MCVYFSLLVTAKIAYFFSLIHVIFYVEYEIAISDKSAIVNVVRQIPDLCIHILSVYAK